MKFKMADNTDEELSIGWFSIISLTFRIRNLIQDFSVKSGFSDQPTHFTMIK